MRDMIYKCKKFNVHTKMNRGCYLNEDKVYTIISELWKIKGLAEKYDVS